MKDMIIILIGFIICNLLYAQTDEVGIVILSEKLGEVIDLEERNAYKLFPAVKGFKSAILYKLPDGTYDFEIIHIDESTGEEIQYRINRSQSQINQLRDHIESSEESRNGDIETIEDKNTYSSDITHENDVQLRAPSFYLGDLAYNKPKTSLRFL